MNKAWEILKKMDEKDISVLLESGLLSAYAPRNCTACEYFDNLLKKGYCKMIAYEMVAEKIHVSLEHAIKIIIKTNKAYRSNGTPLNNNRALPTNTTNL